MSGDWIEAGKRLQEQRLAAGLTQMQVAAEAGLHEVTVSQCESGNRNIGAASRAKIAAAIQELASSKQNAQTETAGEVDAAIRELRHVIAVLSRLRGR